MHCGWRKSLLKELQTSRLLKRGSSSKASGSVPLAAAEADLWMVGDACRKCLALLGTLL